MSATQVIPFSQRKDLPAHIAKTLEDVGSNIDPRFVVPQLSFRGKVWRTVIDGDEQTLTKDDEPISTVHVVVLNHNKARSRSYYEDEFEEGKATAPTCWSSNGEVPDDAVPETQKQAVTCAKCPNSVKGSKVTPRGKETTACSVYKRIAVLPVQDMTFPPMLLRLAQTSMWDKNNEEGEAKGYYAWDQYLDMLRQRGATNTGVVATKIRFDSRVAYPKLLFAASRWLTDEELEVVKPLFKSEAVESLLRAPEPSLAARKSAKAADDDDDDAAPPASVKKKKATAVVEDDDDDDAAPPPKKKIKVVTPADDDEDDTAPPPKKAKAAPADDDEDEAPAPKKKAKATPVEDDADDDEAPAPKKKAKAAPAEDEDEDEPAPVAKKKKAAVVEDEDEAPAPKKKAKVAPVDDEDEEPTPVAKKKGKNGAGLEDLLDDWDKK